MTVVQLPTARAARVAAVAALVANVLIVLTGALVRLTGSGLGCPTWPRCTGDSFVTTPELGAHGVVEFGNRVLGVVVGLVVLALVVAVARYRGRPRGALPLAVGALVGVGVQGLVGGLSVRREPAPEVVAAHFLASMVLVAAPAVLVDLLGGRVGRPPRWVLALPAALTAVLVLGALVTGSGPHAGDEDARRLGLDAAVLTSAHVVTAALVVAATTRVVVRARSVRARPGPA